MEPKSTVEMLGNALAAFYATLASDWRRSLLSMAFTDWHQDPLSEVEALAYFAVQLAVSLAGKKAESIMTAFLSASPSVAEKLGLFEERADDYWDVLQDKGGAEGLCDVGTVFSQHARKEYHPGVALLIASSFREGFLAVKKQVEDSLDL